MKDLILKAYNDVVGDFKSRSDANSRDCLEIISDGPCGRWVCATKEIKKGSFIGYYYGTVKHIDDMREEDEPVFCRRLSESYYYVDGDEQCLAAVMQHLPREGNKGPNRVAYENVEIAYS